MTKKNLSVCCLPACAIDCKRFARLALFKKSHHDAELLHWRFGHSSNDMQIAHRSIHKGSGAQRPAQKSPRACICNASAAAGTCALASASWQVGGEGPKETPIASKLAGKLQLACSQVCACLANIKVLSA